MTDGLFLSLPSAEDESCMDSMMRGWREHGGRINPGLLRKFDGDYEKWLTFVKEQRLGINIGDGVPQTLWFMKNEDGALLGAAALGHYLNSSNSICGGHIAYGIAPSFRGRGYGNRILALTLTKTREMGIKEVLITCATDNKASESVILHNGGVFLNSVPDGDEAENRYLIHLTEEK